MAEDATSKALWTEVDRLAEREREYWRQIPDGDNDRMGVDWTRWAVVAMLRQELEKELEAAKLERPE